MKDMVIRIIEAMNFPRSQSEGKITELGMQLRRHLVKIYLFPEASYVKGWTKEVRNWYTEISDYSTSLKKGKKFTAAEVTKFLYGEWYTEAGLEDLADAMTEVNDELTPRSFKFAELHTTLTIVFSILGECAVKKLPWKEVVAKIMAELK